MSDSMIDRFRRLHAEGTFLLPNPWDLGSARILESLGFPALATTSSGQAAAMGRYDQTVSLDELLAHAEDLVGGIGVPLNLDSERCFAETPGEVTTNVTLMAQTGAAGCSIEDYNPATGAIDPIGMATERVAAAAEGARPSGLMLTARTENHLYGVDDLDDTIARLLAFIEAGADVVYAPGLVDLDRIGQVVSAVDEPVNVLALPNAPSVTDLAAVGVRRISTGASLLRFVHGALVTAGRELLDQGTSDYARDSITAVDLKAAFGPRV